MRFKKTIVVFSVLIAVASIAAKDLKNDIYIVQSVAPGAKTASTTSGTAVDMKGYNSATVVVEVGLHSDATHKIQLEESSDNSSWSTVSAANIIGATVSIANTTVDNTTYWFGAKDFSRYLRVAGSIVGSTTTGCVWGASIIKGHPGSLPAQ